MPARILTAILYVALIGVFTAAMFWLRAAPREIAEPATPETVTTVTTVMPIPTTLPVTTTIFVPATTATVAPRVVSKPTTTTTAPESASERNDEPSTISLDDPDMDAWRAIALCEMPGPGGVPSKPWGAHWTFIGSTDGWSGALGIYNRTWRAYGGAKYGPTAGHATWQQQIEVARNIRDGHGYSAWGCGKRLGN